MIVRTSDSLWLELWVDLWAAWVSLQELAPPQISAEDAAKLIQTHWRKAGRYRSRTRHLYAESAKSI